MSEMSVDSDGLHAAVGQAKVKDRRERIFREALSVLTCALVVVSIVTFGFRQQQYHAQTTRSNERVACVISTLDKILLELQQSQIAAIHHTAQPVFTYPKPC